MNLEKSKEEKLDIRSGNVCKESVLNGKNTNVAPLGYILQ